MPLKSLASVLTSWWDLTRRAADAWLDDHAPSMGAALSYYTFFSLAPLLLIVISVAGLIFGTEAAQGQLARELRGLFGDDAAKSIQALIASVNQPGEGLMATFVGIGMMLFGATTVFAELQDALDRIWRAPARPSGSSVWALLRARVLSFGLILGFAFLLIVSLVFGALITALGSWWGSAFGAWLPLAQALNVLLGFVLTTLVFATIYKVMPRAKVRWRDVWVGALVTSALFAIGKFLIAWYLGRGAVLSAYGAAGSLVVVLLWVYYSAQIFLFGAEFTAARSRAESVEAAAAAARPDSAATAAAAGTASASASAAVH